MRQRKVVTGAPNAWKSPAHDFRPFVANQIDPDYNDPLSKINNMLYRSRVEKWMEETGCTYQIISGLLHKTIEKFNDLDSLSPNEIEKLCKMVRVNKDYFYHKTASYHLQYQQPVMFKTSEVNTKEANPMPTFSAEERWENLKTRKGQIRQYLSEYYDLNATEDGTPCMKVIQGFKQFRAKNDLGGSFPDVMIIGMVLELGYQREFVVEGQYIIPKIRGIKLKMFVKTSNMGSAIKAVRVDQIPDSKEMNLIRFNRVIDRIKNHNIKPMQLMKWVGRSVPYIYALYSITGTNWVYKGFINNIAWMLETTPDYLTGKCDDPDHDADTIKGTIGRAINQDWYVMMDGRLLTDFSDRELVGLGIPSYMIKYVRSGKRVVLADVADGLARLGKISDESFIDRDPNHFPETDAALVHFHGALTKPTQEEEHEEMSGNSVKIKQAVAAISATTTENTVETLITNGDADKPQVSGESLDTKTGLKRFCDDYLTFTKSGNDMILTRPLFNLYEEYCDKYHYSHKLYGEFVSYIKSRGGRVKRTPEGQDLLARVSSNSLVQVLYKGPKTNPGKVVVEITNPELVQEAETIPETKVEEVKPTMKNTVDTPELKEAKEKLDISFDTRHIMTLIDSATEEEIEDLETQMETVASSLEKLKQYIKLARQIKAMKENAYN